MLPVKVISLLKVINLKSLPIIGVTLNSKLTFETHLRKIVLKAAMSLGIVRQAEKLFDCPRMLKSCFNALPVESHVGMLGSKLKSCCGASFGYAR